MNGELVPAFDWTRVMAAPWTTDLPVFGWIFAMGFLVTAACGLVGNFLLLRRMALMGDAVSHSVLPGLAIAYLLSGSRGTLPMFIGAVAAGLLTTLVIEAIHRGSRIRQDAAIGIAFSTLFALGVVLITLFADQVDLDADCVLHGEIAFVPLEPLVHLSGVPLAPAPVLRMGVVLLVVALLVAVCYKELLVGSFDPALAATLGLRPGLVHYGLMAGLSLVVVSAFEAVGAILVIAMLILPGATARLLASRLPRLLVLSLGHAALSTVLGVHLAVWLDCSIAPAIVVAGAALFGLAWVIAPREGLWARLRRARHSGSDSPQVRTA